MGVENVKCLSVQNETNLENLAVGLLLVYKRQATIWTQIVFEALEKETFLFLRSNKSKIAYQILNIKSHFNFLYFLHLWSNFILCTEIIYKLS